MIKSPRPIINIPYTYGINQYNYGKFIVKKSFIFLDKSLNIKEFKNNSINKLTHLNRLRFYVNLTYDENKKIVLLNTIEHRITIVPFLGSYLYDIPNNNFYFFPYKLITEFDNNTINFNKKWMYFRAWTPFPTEYDLFYTVDTYCNDENIFPTREFRGYSIDKKELPFCLEYSGSAAPYAIICSEIISSNPISYPVGSLSDAMFAVALIALSSWIYLNRYIIPSLTANRSDNGIINQGKSFFDIKVGTLWFDEIICGIGEPIFQIKFDKDGLMHFWQSVRLNQQRKYTPVERINTHDKHENFNLIPSFMLLVRQDNFLKIEGPCFVKLGMNKNYADIIGGNINNPNYTYLFENKGKIVNCSDCPILIGMLPFKTVNPIDDIEHSSSRVLMNTSNCDIVHSESGYYKYYALCDKNWSYLLKVLNTKNISPIQNETPYNQYPPKIRDASYPIKEITNEISSLKSTYSDKYNFLSIRYFKNLWRNVDVKSYCAMNKYIRYLYSDIPYLNIITYYENNSLATYSTFINNNGYIPYQINTDKNFLNIYNFTSNLVMNEIKKMGSDIPRGTKIFKFNLSIPILISLVKPLTSNDFKSLVGLSQMYVLPSKKKEIIKYVISDKVDLKGALWFAETNNPINYYILKLIYENKNTNYKFILFKQDVEIKAKVNIIKEIVSSEYSFNNHNMNIKLLPQTLTDKDGFKFFNYTRILIKETIPPNQVNIWLVDFDCIEVKPVGKPRQIYEITEFGNIHFTDMDVNYYSDSDLGTLFHIFFSYHDGIYEYKENVVINNGVKEIQKIVNKHEISIGKGDTVIKPNMLMLSPIENVKFALGLEKLKNQD